MKVIDKSYDVIHLSGMSFFGRHGSLSIERKIGNHYQANIKIYTNTQRAAQTDNIKKTVDYRDIFNIVQGIIEKQSFTLLETIAERIAEKILAAYNIYAVEVAVRKYHPPLSGIVDFVEVIIYRKKE
jgi:dihydroneopterin aldolase